MTVPASFPHSIKACLTPKDLLLSHLHLTQRSGSPRNPKRHWKPAPCQAPWAGEAPLPFPRAQGTDAAHQKFSVRCFTSSAKAGLLTFSLSHLLTVRLHYHRVPLLHLTLSPSKKPPLGMAKAETTAPALLLIEGCTTLCTFLQLRCGPGKKSIVYEPGQTRYKPG